MTPIKSVVVMLKKASFMGAFFCLLFTQTYALASFCPPPVGVAEFFVSNVIDGDTLRLQDGRRIRLIGIDTPELGGRGRVTQPYADKARQHLAERIKANGNKVGVSIGEQSHDRYGRVLAHIYDQAGVSLEEQLIAAGLAYHVVIAPNVALAQCLAQAESKARIKGIGLWKNAAFISAQHIKTAGFTLLQGRIRSVERNSAGVWLELGHSAVINIPSAALHYFTENQSLESLVGRKVQARGWISERKSQQHKYAKWRLTVSYPSMLELK